MRRDEGELQAVLAQYDGLEQAACEPLGAGLINETYLLRRASGAPLVLQRVNPIFDPQIHVNIEAVTVRLAALGLPTPRLVPTVDGRLWVEPSGGGVYRLQTYVEGVSFDAVQGAAQARGAGVLVGRFHAALEGLDHSFVGARVGVHDTAAHLERLRRALDERRGHRLWEQVRASGEELLERAAALAPLPALAARPCHGDLKLNNILFVGRDPPGRERARCLIDLDTLGPMQLAHELGDAWRSWCNPHGEDDVEGAFDLEAFRASLEGYSEGLGRTLSPEERRALLLGVEWVSLEVAVRFAADALFESYFGFDRSRYRAAGEHNLVRALGQLALHRAVLATREARARLLGVDPR